MPPKSTKKKRVVKEKCWALVHKEGNLLSNHSGAIAYDTRKDAETERFNWEKVIPCTITYEI